MPKKQSSKKISITKSAKLLGISPDTLRRLEKKGKVKPERGKGGKRLYSEKQIEALKLITKPGKTKKKLFTLNQTAKILGVSKSTIRRWDNQDKIKSKRTAGGHRRFDLDEIKRALDHDKQPPSPKSLSGGSEEQLVRTLREDFALAYQLQPKVQKYLFLLGIIILLGIFAYVSKGQIGAKLASFRQGSIPQKLSEYIINTQEPNEIDSLKQKIISESLQAEDAQVLAATSFNNAQLLVDVAGTFTQDVSFEQNIDVGLDANIGRVLNLEGNTITSNDDILIAAGGGGISIGNETPSVIDLDNDDLFISGELEVAENLFGSDASFTGNVNVDGNATIGADASVGTLTINSETFSDLTGAGLTISAGALTTTIGDSIESGEITDGTITEVDLNVSNSPSNSYVLTYNSSTGGFTWAADQTGAVGLWTDGGAVTYLTATSDDLAIGGTNSSAPFFFDVSTGNLTFTGNLSAAAATFSGNVDAQSGLDITGADFTVGGTNASITTAGVITGTQLSIDNLQLDGQTLSATSGDIILSTGADVIITNLDCTSNANGGALTANASGLITCTDDDGGVGTVSPWVDTGTVVALVDTTKNVTVGSTSTLGKLAVDGDNDEIQLLIQAFGTQTQDLAVFEQSDGTDVLTIDNSGNLSLLSQADVRFFDSDNSDYSGFQAPSNYTGTPGVYTLPTGYPGTTGFLKSNTSGTLSWDTNTYDNYVSWTLTGDAGDVDQTISSGDTLSLLGGTGINTAAANTDQLTIDFDSTELNNLTWGDSSQASITWNYALSGSNDPSLVFSDDTITVTGDILPPSNNTGSIGASGTQFQTIYGQSVYQNNNQVCDTSGNCSGVTGFWAVEANAIHPRGEYASVADVLIGGTSTASADFAFLNVNSGTPTASISGNVVLNSAGSLQTTNNQTLTLGGNSTGNISLSPLNGSGLVDISGNLDVSGTLTSGTADAFSVDSSGNVTSGTWTATAIAPQYGGTGDDTSATTGVPYITSGNWQYESALSLSRGGTGASLADPGADRIYFWDDSAGTTDWLTVGSGLTITDTTIAANDTSATNELQNLWATFTAEDSSNTTADTQTDNLSINGTGIDTTISGDTLSVNFDSTELNDLTWGDNSDSSISWTFNSSGSSDTSLTFEDNALTLTAATTTISGNLSVYGTQIGLNNDADAENLIALSAAGGAPSGNLYWGNRQICDTSGNCSGVTGFWAVEANAIYPRGEYAGVADVLVGGSATASASVRLSSNGNIYIGTDSSSDDDFIYFDDGSSEFISWDEAPGEFDISDDVNVAGNVTGNGGTFGNIQVGITNDNTIDTTSGNLTLDSNGGTLDINDNIDLSSQATDIEIIDTNASALTISQSTNNYFTIDTSSEAITFGNATTNPSFTFSGSGGLLLSGSTLSDATDEVDINDSLAVSSSLQVGGTSALAYNRFGTGTASHTAGGEIEDTSDVYITDDLEVDGNIWADGTIFQGGNQVCDTGGNCSGSGLWQVTDNAFYPRNEYAGVVDVLIGGSATAAADFAFKNIAAGTATLTIGGDVDLFRSAANTLSLGSNDDLLVPGGDITGANSESIDIGEAINGTIVFQGAGGGDNTNLYLDLDGAYPILYSNTDTAVGIDDNLTLVGARTISNTSGNMIIDPAANLDIDSSTIDLSTQVTNIDLINGNSSALTFETSLLRLDTSSTSVEVTGTTNLGDGGSSNYAQFSTTGDLAFFGTGDSITGPGGNGLAITNDGGNISVTTSTSGDVTIGPATSEGTGDDLILQDGTLIAPVPLTLSDTAINASLSQAIIDAINDVFDAATGQGANGLWKLNTNVISPNNGSHSFALGATGLSTANFAWDSSTDTITMRQTGANDAFVVEDESSDTTPFVINQSGNVGIGTTSPVSKLHVTSTVTGKALAIFDDTGTDQNILTASASGTTALTLSRAGDLTLYSTTSTADRIAIVPKNTAGTAATGTITSADLSTNRTWEFPNEAGTVCLTTGNCAGVGGVGDIEAVGDILSGSAFTQTAGNDGNSLWFEGTTADSNEIQLTAADTGSDITVTIPAIDGTLASLAGDQTFTGVKTFETDVNFTFAGSENLAITSNLAGSVNVINITGTPSTSAGTAYGIYIDQANSSNSNGFDAFAVLDNSDTNLTVADGILFSSAGGVITDAIDASVSQIVNALNVGGNTITGTTYTIQSTSGDITIDSADELVLTDGDTIIIGGHAGNVDYNVIANSGQTANSGLMDDDNDLYIGGDLEVDGSIYQGANQVCDTSGNCSGAGLWQNTSNAFHPRNEFASVADVLIGGSATASAKIGFTNIAGGTPTIDVSNQATNIEINNNSASALDITDGTNSYITLNTSGEAITFGNTSTNPTFTYSGSGGIALANSAVSDSSDEVDINDDLAVSGDLQVGSATGTSYSRFGTSSSGHSLSGASDVLISGDLELNGVFYADGNTVLGNSNSDTLTINAGQSGTGIAFGDSSFDTCTALETVGGVLTCGSDSGGVDSGWNDDGTTVRLLTATDYVAIGANTADGKLGVTGQRAGQALAIFDYLGTDQNILSASASGTTRMNLTNAGQLELVTDGSTAGLTIGAGEDLSLYHDGSNSYIANTTGNLIFDATNDIYLDADGADILFRDNTTTFATFTNSSTDLSINIAGGQLLLADGDTFNIGGLTGQTTNTISNAAGASIDQASDDNDLYIQGILEVDGSIYQAGSQVCDTSGNCTGSGLWALSSNAFYPRNQYAGVVDILVGGSATASASVRLSSNGNIYLGTDSSSDDDFIYFDDGSSEFISWDEAPGEFDISDDVNVAGNVTGNGGTFGNIQVGITNDNTIDTTSGNLTLDSNGGTLDINDNIDLSSQATDIEIINTQATALSVSEGSNNYLTISTDATEAVTLDLPVAGGTSTTGNLFTSNIAKTINLGTGTLADTIFIGTNNTTGDSITIGNNNTSTSLALTGGDEWSMAASGLLTISPSGSLTTAIDVTDSGITNAISLGTNTILASGSFSINLANAANDTLTITNSSSGFASVSIEGDLAVNGEDITSSTDLRLNPSGGDVYINNGDTLIIGGHAGGVNYNVISDSGGSPTSGQINSDDDLYIEGTLEASAIYQGSNQVCDTSGNCSGSGLWQNTSNAFHPRDAFAGVVDVLVGGSSTSSAAIRLSANGTAVFNEQGVASSDFRVEGDSDANLLFVDSSADAVGIGNNNPGLYKLNVSGNIFASGGSLDGIQAYSTSASGLYAQSSTGIALNARVTGNGGPGLYVRSDGTGDIVQFWDSTTEVFEIEDGGNVGIGTNNPDALLDVRGTSYFNNTMTFRDPNPTNRGFITYSGSPNRFVVSGSSGNPLSLGSDGTFDRVYLNTSGNLGIGTTNINHKLDVNGNIGLAGNSYINWGTTDGSTGYGFRDNTGTMEYKNSGGSWTTFDSLAGGGSSEWNDTGTLLHPGDLSGAEDVAIGGTTAANSDIFLGGASGNEGVAVFNEQGLTGGDFRIESDNLTHAIFVDASADAIGINNSSPTHLLDINANSLAANYALDVSSTSTSLTSGRLLNLDWSPGSSTTATGDLFRLNIGSNGNVANLLNITDNGSTLFRVAENQIESAIPHAFTAAGDLVVAYDIQFTNETSSSVKSSAPLTIEAGDSFESNNLTLKTYNSGDIVLDLASSGNLRSVNLYSDTVGTTNRDLFIDDTGVIGYVSSSIRYKENVADYEDLDWLYQLRPVTFTYTADKNKIPQYGLIAEEVEDVNQLLVSYDAEGRPETVSYNKLVTPLLKAVQEQNEKIIELRSDIDLITLNGSGNIVSVQDSENPEYLKLKDGQGNFIDKLSGLSNLITQNVKAGYGEITQIVSDRITSKLVKTEKIQTDEITSEEGNLAIKLFGNNQNENSGFGKLLIKARDGSTVASIDEEGNADFEGRVTSSELDTENATVAGELRVGKIVADDIISPNSLTRDEIEALLKEAETSQNSLNQAQNWDTQPSADSTASFNELVLENLYVTGTSVSNVLSVTQSISLGTDLIIASAANNQQLSENTIDSLDNPLSIQSSAAQPLFFMAGLVRIDTQGNMHIAGNLAVSGNIESSSLKLKEDPDVARESHPGGGTISGFGKLLSLIDTAGNETASVTASGAAKFASVKTEDLFAGQISVSDDPNATSSATFAGLVYETSSTAGSARVPQGSRDVMIKNPNIKSDSLVFITPTSEYQGNIFVKEQKDGEFMVGFTSAAQTDVNFNWWIVGVNRQIGGAF